MVKYILFLLFITFNVNAKTNCKKYYIDDEKYTFFGSEPELLVEGRICRILRNNKCFVVYVARGGSINCDPELTVLWNNLK